MKQEEEVYSHNNSTNNACCVRGESRKHLNQARIMLIFTVAPLTPIFLTLASGNHGHHHRALNKEQDTWLQLKPARLYYAFTVLLQHVTSSLPNASTKYRYCSYYSNFSSG